jgi:type VI secretion system secreted protein Hcp
MSQGNIASPATRIVQRSSKSDECGPPVCGNASNEFLDPPLRPVVFSRCTETIIAMPAFLRLGDIKGESGDARFPGWIRLESVQLPQLNQGVGRVSREQQRDQLFVGDITLTMRHGSASSEVANAVASSRHFPSVTIVFDEGMTIELTDVLLSGYSFHGSSGDAVPVETVILNFASAEFIPQAQFPAKPVGSPPPAQRPARRRR